MTEFSMLVVNCITEWGKKSAACNGNRECLEHSARQLRQCLDAAFPDSEKVELESDKVNYMLSSVFFLANRLSKATEGLAEFDRVMNSIGKVGRASLEEKREPGTAHQIPKRARRHPVQILLEEMTRSFIILPPFQTAHTLEGLQASHP